VNFDGVTNIEGLEVGLELLGFDFTYDCHINLFIELVDLERNRLLYQEKKANY
jgi:hypothetical protein